MKIGILQTGHVPEELIAEHGEYPAMFERMLADRGFEFATYAVVENELPGAVDEMDGWLITGSKHGAYDNEPWIAPLEAFIRTAFERDIPVAGICFGHQIIAQALGGRVEKFAGGWGAGRSLYDAGELGRIALYAMHQDQVVEIPPNAEVIMSNEFCKYAGLAYDGRAIGIQPHPEYECEFAADLIRARRGKAMPEAVADRALESFAEGGSDAPLIVQMLTDFFAEARQELAKA